MDMDMQHQYHPPLALTVISGLFLCLGAICMVIVAADIIWRRGWKSMMAIMIPVYIINAAYLGPLAVWIYYRYGRPSVPRISQPAVSPAPCHTEKRLSGDSTPQQHSCHGEDVEQGHGVSNNPTPDAASHSQPAEHCCQPSSRPFPITVLVGVFHCGAGCVLGDLVGEWLVYGTGATIKGHDIWAELLIDYGFALLFGIAFQYMSIAPMSGAWGPATVWRAAQADILSLTGFEVGAFGWMVAYQVGIWGYRLEMTTWTYWWMMQVGMGLGCLTAFPVNWILIRNGVKEPCC